METDTVRCSTVQAMYECTERFSSTLCSALYLSRLRQGLVRKVLEKRSPVSFDFYTYIGEVELKTYAV